MVKIERYQARDLLLVPLRSIVEDHINKELIVNASHKHALCPVSLTMRDDKGSVLCCFGIDDFWPGTGQLWSAIAPGALKVPGAYRKLKIIVDKVWDQFDYNRWQAVVNAEDPEAMLLVQHLGMKKEVLMKRYGPDDVDCWLYARVR